MPTEKKHIYQRVGIITFFTLISRILGAARDIVLLHVFGAGMIHDAYVVAQTIPNALRRLTAEGSMTLAFVPIYTDVREKHGQQQAQLFAQKALGLVYLATICLTILGVMFSSEIVALFASGFKSNPEKFELAVFLTKLMFPYLVFVSIVAWAMGVLNAEKKFAAPAAAPIFLNAGIICGALALSHWVDPKISGVAYGILFGGLLQVLLQWPSLRTIGQPFIPRGFWKDPNIKRLLFLLAPSLFGVAVYEINIVILRTIASTFPDGQLTYYYSSSRLTELVTGLFAFAFASASFPELSKMAVSNKWQEMVKMIQFAFSGAMFIILPATMGLVFAAEPIVKMLYLHGAFTVADADYTINVLRAFAITIPAYSFTRILLPVYYSLKDAKTPVYVAFFTLFITGGLGYWFGQKYQVVGLGFGLACGAWFQCSLLYILLKFKVNFNFKIIPYGQIFNYVFCSCLAGGVAYAIVQYGNWNLGPKSLINYFLLVSIILAAAICYFSLMLIFKDPHVKRLKKMIIK